MQKCPVFGLQIGSPLSNLGNIFTENMITTILVEKLFIEFNNFSFIKKELIDAFFTYFRKICEIPLTKFIIIFLQKIKQNSSNTTFLNIFFFSKIFLKSNY